MNKALLVVSLFVHDMKAPLAVIDSDAKKICAAMDRRGSVNRARALPDLVLVKKKQAQALLNQILVMDAAPAQPGVGGGWAGRLIGLFSGRRKKMEKAPRDLPSAVTLLKNSLAEQRDLIQAMQTKIGPDDIGSHGAAVLKRMRRNARTALHFADNALALLEPDRPGPAPAPTTVADIIRPAMIEVFDLLDTDISEAARTTRTLPALVNILAVKQVFLDIDESLWQARMDCEAEKITQVLVNLMLNAFKFRTETIRVTAVSESQERLRFCVSDDGKGIAEKDQPFIFKNRFQVKSSKQFPVRGHGIGLAGAQALLEGIGGRLELDSSPGRLTCFCAVLESVEWARPPGAASDPEDP